MGKAVVYRGAKITSCGLALAQKWGLSQKMFATKHIVKYYNSPTIVVRDISQWFLIYGKSSIPVKWYIISIQCQPILSGNKVSRNQST